MPFGAARIMGTVRIMGIVRCVIGAPRVVITPHWHIYARAKPDSGKANPRGIT